MPLSRKSLDGGIAINAKTLKARLISHDEGAIADLSVEYGRLLWVVAGRRLPKGAGFNASDVEDCITDAFVALWKDPQMVDDSYSDVRPFLCALVDRRAIDAYRKATKSAQPVSSEFFESAEDVASSSDPEHMHLSSFESRRVWKALQQLEKTEREIVIRRFYLEQKPASIAAVMDLPVKTVDNKLYLAKKHLKTMLSSQH